MSVIFKDDEHLKVLGLTCYDELVFHIYIFYVMKCVYGIRYFMVLSVL